MTAGCIPVADSCTFVMNFGMFWGLSEVPTARVRGAHDSLWGEGSFSLPSPSSTWCWAEPENCWGFTNSSFPILQLQRESGRSFQCGGIPGNREGHGLKAGWGFVQWGGLARTSPEKQGGKVPCAIV